MDLDIHSVTSEVKDPTFKDFLKAAFAYATFRPARARSYLRGEQAMFARNEAGEKVFGMSGGGQMTIYTRSKQLDTTDAMPQQACRMKGGFRL